MLGGKMLENLFYSIITHSKVYRSLLNLYSGLQHLQDVGDRYKGVREASKICEFLTFWTDKSLTHYKHKPSWSCAVAAHKIPLRS